MTNDKIRIVAYQKSQNNYYYYEMPPGSTMEEAYQAALQYQAAYGKAWIEIYDNGCWEEYKPSA
jgi:hypothetical protein